MTNSEFWRRNVVSVVLFILLFGVMLTVQFLSQKSRTPLAPRAVELVGAKSDSAQSELILNLASKRLSSAPNDPHSLNLLYVEAVDKDPQASLTNRIGALLSRLGWRYSPVQQNLLTTAVANRDFEAIVKNSDALLRRNQAPDQILALLRLFEIEAGTREYLVQQLAFDPPWKAAFLRQVGDLETASQAKARGLTLAMMLADGQQINRMDIAPSLNAIVRAGEAKIAWALYRPYSKFENSSLINDPSFLRLAETRDIPQYRSLPFDWQVHSTRGLQVSASESIGKADIQIRWNGRGTPLMLSQYVYTPQAVRYKLELTGLDALPRLTKTVVFALNCDQRTFRFENIQNDLKANKITLITEQPVTCQFPRFEIRGRIQDVSRPQTVSLSSLDIFEIR